MRISLNIECETLEDFQKVMGALAATPAVRTEKIVTRVAETLHKLQQEQEPTKPAPAPTPPPSSPEEEPKPTEPEAPPAEPEPPVAAKKARGRPKKEPKPEAPVAPPAEPTRPSVFTRDDLTAAFREYVVKFGYGPASSDVSKLLQQNLGAGVRKSSDVSDDDIAKAISIVKAAVTENPFGRDLAPNG